MKILHYCHRFRVFGPLFLSQHVALRFPPSWSQFCAARFFLKNFLIFSARFFAVVPFSWIKTNFLSLARDNFSGLSLKWQPTYWHWPALFYHVILCDTYTAMIDLESRRLWRSRDVCLVPTDWILFCIYWRVSNLHEKEEIIVLVSLIASTIVRAVSSITGWLSGKLRELLVFSQLNKAFCILRQISKIYCKPCCSMHPHIVLEVQGKSLNQNALRVLFGERVPARRV